MHRIQLDTVFYFLTDSFDLCTDYSLAGYNHLDVVEFLLENRADVNAKDKGGLIPLHNASSFGVSIIVT